MASLLDFLKGNAGAIGTVVGAGAGLFAGNPFIGASIGGALGGALQGSGKGQNMPMPSSLPQYQRLANPQYGLRQFQKVATRGLPTLADFLAMHQATRGSNVMAREQYEQSQHQALANAHNAFGQWRLGLDNALLGADMQGLQWQAGKIAQDDAARRSMGNEWLGGGMSLLGYLLGPETNKNRRYS